LVKLLAFGAATLARVLVLLVDCFPLLSSQVIHLEVVHFVGDLMDASENEDVAVLVKSDLVATLLER
jgi:hypothetical protein